MKKSIFIELLLVASTALAEVKAAEAKPTSAETDIQQKMARPKAQIIASVDALESRIKSCLAGIYDEQMELHKDKGTFSAVTTELRAVRSHDCESLDLSTQMADGEEFTVVARSGDMVWSVDQSKTIEQIR